MIIAIALAVLALACLMAIVVYGGKFLVSLTNPNDPTHAPGAHILRYHLAVGQDSSTVVDAVRNAGYHAATEFVMGRVDLVVLCTGDPAVERERVRTAIAAAPDRQGIHGDLEVPAVHFVDELD